MISSFEYHSHYCIVTEFLSMDLYQVLKVREYNGLPISLIRVILKQLLHDLVALQKVGVIHGDIKPENIMLTDGFSSSIKLIDFGSAQVEGNFNASYFQSRYYRAPEVILNLPYDYKVDIWSVACVAIEMFIANPIFGGQNELHLLQIITRFAGKIPTNMIQNSPKKEMFFNQDLSMKSLTQFCKEQGQQIPEFEEYLFQNNITDLIMKYHLGLNKTGANKIKEMTRRQHFADLMQSMLTIDPAARPSAQECLSHPFLTS